MSTELFEVKFASSEKEFLTQFGVNFGFSQVHSKVDRCYFLSSNAKQLYHNLSHYAFSGHKEIFPSQSTLLAELGWTKPTLVKYTDELREAGMISTTQNNNGTLVYVLRELHTVPTLAHSEIVHEIRKELFKTRPKSFLDLLTEYRLTEIFALGQSNPIEHQSAIRKWFSDRCVSEPIKDSGGGSTGDATATKEEEGSEVKIVLPKPIRLKDVEKVSTVEEKVARKKVSKNPAEVPIEEWNINHFMSYFRIKYHEFFSTEYIPNPEEPKAMKRILETKGDRETVRRYIDHFFSIPHFIPKTVRLFASANTQSVLDSYDTTGKLPWYMEKSVPSALPNNSDKYDVFS